jgi:D-alanyl-D-alanine carboxypeptidase
MKTNKKLSLISLTLLMSSIIGLPISASADNLDTQLQNEINAHVAQYAATEGFTAIQLSVLLPNQTVPRDYIAGLQMKEAATPATTTMLVQWGSITKEFTSLLLFQYLNKHPGSFSLDTTLFTMLPEHFGTNNTAWPDAWKNVTIKQLMNMTSGIPEYLGLPTFNPYQVTDLKSIVDAVADYQNGRGCQMAFGCFSAGQGWYYSNTNYIILGMMVEKLYGANFSDVIQQQILAGMQQAGNNVVYQTPYTPTTLENMINAYCTNGWQPFWSPDQNVTNANLNIAASAGALTGNTHALVKIIYALFHDQFLPNAQMQPFLNSGWVRTDTHQAIDINSELAKQVCTKLESCFGLGFLVTYDPTYGQVWEYPGGTMGFITDYIWLPQENVVIALSSNGGVGSAPAFFALRNQIVQTVYQYVNQKKTNENK